MTSEVARVSRVIGQTVLGVSHLSGGDICRASRVDTPAGPVFLKEHQRAPDGFFAAETRGLGVLAAVPEGPRVPRVLGHGATWLAMEWLERVPVTDGGAALGRALVALHREQGGAYGGGKDNFIGTLPQHNRPWDSWVDCWREDRLRPQLEQARPRLSRTLAGACERLLGRLGDLLPDAPPSSRLHGDLWGGNWLQTSTGPAVFDPATSRGDREVDLAMMALFGGFPVGVWAAIEDAWPLAPGALERRPLYQLYPLLVHVNLFGGGYVPQVADVVRRYA